MIDTISLDFAHNPTSFLAANLLGKISIDPAKTTTDTSDVNYVVSSDIYDDRYLCDVPLSGASGCSCAIGSKGLLADGASKVFPGSAIGGAGASVGPLGLPGAVPGVPHPSFRFAQRVNDVSVTMTDVTFPGQRNVVWDAKFRLNGPDGSPGSDYLPSSLAPLGGDAVTFKKLCSAVNTKHEYELKVQAGGDAPISQTIAMDATIVQKPELLDPSVALSAGANPEEAGSGYASMKMVGPRLYTVGGPGGTPPTSQTAPAIRSSAFIEMPNQDRHDGQMFIRGEGANPVPSVTATSFAEPTCGCGEKPVNPPHCYKPPTVTVHYPNPMTMAGRSFF
jgi:hypothetical protein